MSKSAWRRISEAPLHWISSSGVVKREAHDRTYTHYTGSTYTKHFPEVILNYALDSDGYRFYYLTVSIDPIEKKYFWEHRLVAFAFLGDPPEGLDVVMHVDDNIENNHWRNLKWGTQVHNQADKVSKKRQALGSRVGTSVLTESDVRKIWKLLKSGHTLTSIGDQFGVSATNISYIKNGYWWNHVTGLPKKVKPRRKRQVN